MELQKKELIAKLENIADLYDTTVAIQAEMDEFEPEDNYERSVELPEFPGDEPAWEELVDHEDEDACDQMDALYTRNRCPREPKKPDPGKQPENTHETADALKKKLGCLPLVGGFVAICSLISGGLFSGEAGTVIGNLVILAICAGAIVYFLKKYKAAQQTDEEITQLMVQTYAENQQAAEEKYEADMNAYRTDRSAYLLSKADFLEEYAAWRKIYLEYLQEEEQIEEKLEDDRVAAVGKIYDERFVPAQKKLEETNDLITEEYLPVLSVIIDLLKSGRADDLKEAVNLYEELVYRERQLQLQREQEEQRRYEEECRRRDEERRHREEMKFREDQERHRQQEEAQRRSDEERRHKEDLKLQEQHARDEKMRLEKERRSQKRCVWCAHNLTCRQQYYDGAYNCTGFTPKS